MFRYAPATLPMRLWRRWGLLTPSHSYPTSIAVFRYKHKCFVAMYYTNVMPKTKLTNHIAALAVLAAAIGLNGAVFADQTPPAATQSQTEAVTDFKSTILLAHDGSLDVQEHFTYDFGTTAPHPISHRILIGYSDDQGNPLESKFVLVSSQRDNQALNLHPDINGTVATVNLPQGSESGPRTFALHYTLAPAVLAGPDADVFKFSPTGLGWEVPINQASVVFDTPGLTPQTLTCYTGASGSTSSSCRITENKNTATILTDAVLAPGESLSLYTGFPKRSFTNYYNSWSLVSLWPVAAGTAGVILLLVIAATTSRRRGKRKTAPSAEPASSQNPDQNSH